MSKRLPNSTLFAYGVSDLPVMFASMPMMLYLNNFYASDIGIPLMQLANLLLIARVFDLITDPLVGYLSDHTRTRWGRRKPWMTQRFRAPLPEGVTPFELYRRLRAVNPAPFAAYLDFPEVVVASSSPERFLKLRDGRVETRPIKGTRPRGKTPAEDDALALELLASEKDRAENVMIVDLLRNDLSRVCRDESVKVPELCVLETYATVFHLVSTVVGELLPGMTAVDLLKASFPGGSITGAPKIRAMEIIAELEPTQRGPYCGSIGYLSFTGSMDSNIVIRSYAIKDGTVTFQAGGGIVADSKPDAEYEETMDKARALLAALSPSGSQS